MARMDMSLSGGRKNVALVAAAPVSALASCSSGTHLGEATITVRK